MKNNAGFTLIELLVVVIIVGILAAIGLPTFLNQTAKARQSDAKSTISSVNLAQSAYRIEHSNFAPDFGSLALGIADDTANYKYLVVGGVDTTTILATAKDSAQKGYSGGSIRYQDTNQQSQIRTIVCETLVAGITPPDPPTFDPTNLTNPIACPATEVKL